MDEHKEHEHMKNLDEEGNEIKQVEAVHADDGATITEDVMYLRTVENTMEY